MINRILGWILGASVGLLVVLGVSQVVGDRPVANYEILLGNGMSFVVPASMVHSEGPCSVFYDGQRKPILWVCADHLVRRLQ